MDRRGCRIMIDGEVFATLKKAAEFLEINDYDLSGMLNDMSEKTINGFKVKRLDPRCLRIGGKIYCTQTNQLFRNAEALSKYLNHSYVEICKALRVDNKFIKDGNIYRRVQNEDNFKDQAVIDENTVEQLNRLKLDVMDRKVSTKPTSYEDSVIKQMTVNENVFEKFESTEEALKELIKHCIDVDRLRDAKILINAIKVLTTEETEVKN